MSYDNDSTLNPEELEAIELWANGKTMFEAYCEVFGKKEKLDDLPKPTLNKRVHRFFNTPRMKQAMTASSFGREEKVKKEQEKKKAIDAYGRSAMGLASKLQKVVEEEKRKERAEKRAEKERIAKEKKQEKETGSYFFNQLVRPHLTSSKASKESKPELEPTFSDSATDVQIANAIFTKAFEESKEELSKAGAEKMPDVPKKSARERWLESLMITDEPSAISVFGTGQFILYHAVSEMNKRDKAIREKQKNTGIFEANGSVFTPTILSAFKTAASMIIPFAPTQSVDTQKGMSMAFTLLGLMQDEIKEDPDAYTAPPPPTVEIETIDVTKDKDNEN